MRVLLDTHALPQPYATFMELEITTNNFRILHILPKHTSVLTTLPLHHKDPFDRLLIAQAMIEAVPLVSMDLALDQYGITRMW